MSMMEQSGRHSLKSKQSVFLLSDVSREKQKILKDHSPQGVPSPAGSDPDVDFAAKAAVELQLTEAETRLTKHGWGPQTPEGKKTPRWRLMPKHNGILSNCLTLGNYLELWFSISLPSAHSTPPFRNLLLKDEAILRQLLQQEQKKEEALKAAEAKVAKVKEQLLASEKIVSANKTLLNRLQEQVGVKSQEGTQREWNSMGMSCEVNS